MTDSLGAVGYVIGTGIELTDRRPAEEASRASEERFHKRAEEELLRSEAYLAEAEG